MMRSTLLARNPDLNSFRGRPKSSQPTQVSTPPHVPTIRLVEATPSGTENTSQVNSSFNTSFNGSIVTVPSPLAPRHENEVGPRRRLIPKKSKLGLLAASAKAKEKGRDLSDVVRRVGGSASTGRGGFEIYVDPSEDPDFDDIVVVKKKKSRAALDNIRWGSGAGVLGDVTNTTEAGGATKEKGEKDKWWTIGRGRKDSKEKAKGKGIENIPRSKTPEPAKPLSFKNADSRARFNSLDSGVLLTTPTTAHHAGTIPGLPSAPIDAAAPMHGSTPPMSSLRPEAPNACLLAPPDVNSGGPNAGSIAIRAMRSMRSMARIGSWAQLKNPENEGTASSKPKSSKDKEKEKGKEGKTETKKKKRKEKTEKKEEKQLTVRSSTSSWEAGALTASPGTVQSLGKKKSMLGLGWPSTMRLGMARTNSSSTSIPLAQDQNRLSVGSSVNLNSIGRSRAPSTISNGSSLRPVSTSSERTGKSSSGSVVSVRWDEPALETVKEMTKKERRVKRQASATLNEQVRKTSGRGDRESRRGSASRRRTPVTELFQQASVAEVPESRCSPPKHPLLTLEEATEDGHHVVQEVPVETPVKPVRPRPVSEQLLGQAKPARPTPIYDDGEGYISILDAATNDLASLIDRLDLQATPKSIDTSPLKRSAQDWVAMPRPKEPQEDGSPVKKRADKDDDFNGPMLRTSMASITSLRPYAQSRIRTSIPAPAQMVGQQIAPWPISPAKPRQRVQPRQDTGQNAGVTLRRTHKRAESGTPAPAPDLPAFQPLRPPHAKAPSASTRLMSPIEDDESSPEMARTPVVRNEPAQVSSLTFGSRPSKTSTMGSNNGDMDRSPTPASRRSVKQPSRDNLRDSMPIPREARRGLGLTGTMGGSTFSVDMNVDPDDPDSDIPDELQIILAGNSDSDWNDTLTFPINVSQDLPPSPGLPPESPLPEPVPKLSLELPTGIDIPVFRAQVNDEDGNQADIDEGFLASPSEDDTKKSFDFTEELQKLNESGGSDRKSFIEQLETAFRTPASFDLRYGLGDHLAVGFDRFANAPPIPALPIPLRPAEDISQNSIEPEPEVSEFSEAASGSTENPRLGSPVPSIEWMAPEPVIIPIHTAPPVQRAESDSLSPRPSDGKLNRGFRFGGLPSPESEPTPKSVNGQEKPLTLSDIIPSPSHARALSTGSVMEGDDSVLKSIFAKATDIPAPSPRLRLDSDSSSKRRARDHALSKLSGVHSRQVSEASFEGFDSFDEVRRGFEFHPNRPAFYPPPQATYRRGHARDESLFSIGSVSSYGMVLNSGVNDPFDYGLPAPPSDDASSMSLSVDDTFSFLKHQPQRKRVDSDASSFYFQSRNSQLMKRGHRRHESGISVISNGPPVSLYNRSFKGHHRQTSSTSGSSIAHNYAMYGANGGRAAWARHRQDPSVDSILSDFSIMRLSRPDLGDKMFQSVVEHGVPLTAISASPAESRASGDDDQRSSYDSIIDNDRRSSMEDSLFEKTGYRTSVSSESVFRDDHSYSPEGNLRLYDYFRPVSMYSEVSIHSPEKEDDTMISMLGGGHVRRRSIGSIMEASPCIKFGKKKQDEREQVHLVQQIQAEERILEEKPSMASTSSHQFGGRRMQQATRGLLVRQSLEDSCLSAQGVDDTTTSWVKMSLSDSTHTTRPRSGTSTTYASSGTETPPLSSDGSSQSGGSQSSIDISHLDALLANMTYPVTNRPAVRTRARSRGAGHRRRISQARASRHSVYSVYETIQEELSGASSPSSPSGPPSADATISSVPASSVLVVDQDIDSMEWDDEGGVTVLRRYYALRHEAQETLEESKRVWVDTPFSLFAVQSFQPPCRPEGMKALLEHSQQSYGPLPSELRPHRMRSRADSRPSPYPRSKLSLSPEEVRIIHVERHPEHSQISGNARPSVLQDVSVHPNILSPPPALDTIKAVSPLVVKFDKSQGEDSITLSNQAPRPRVTSSVRRNALGWSKRSTTAKSKENKENVFMNESLVMSAPQSLRINRPRPRGRPTPARR